jgi:hypothetical protein
VTTALAFTYPRPRPFGLVRADLLKLRRRWGLVATIAAMTVGSQVVAYSVLAILHAANPDKHGPAGGLANFGHGLFLLNLLGGVAGIIVGASAGADDLTSGVFRELVVTGRSRLALFASRIPGGLAFLLPFVVVAFSITAVVSSTANGALPVLSTTQLVESGLWLLASVTFSYILGLAVASLTGSRAYTIGVLLAWQLIVGRLLLAISALGVGRELVPDAALTALAPHAIRNNIANGPVIGMSFAAIAAVLLSWIAVWLSVGAWRTVTREA